MRAASAAPSLACPLRRRVLHQGQEGVGGCGSRSLGLGARVLRDAVAASAAAALPAQALATGPTPRCTLRHWCAPGVPCPLPLALRVTKSRGPLPRTRVPWAVPPRLPCCLLGGPLPRGPLCLAPALGSDGLGAPARASPPEPALPPGRDSHGEGASGEGVGLLELRDAGGPLLRVGLLGSLRPALRLRLHALYPLPPLRPPPRAASAQAWSGVHRGRAIHQRLSAPSRLALAAPAPPSPRPTLGDSAASVFKAEGHSQHWPPPRLTYLPLHQSSPSPRLNPSLGSPPGLPCWALDILSPPHRLLHGDVAGGIAAAPLPVPLAPQSFPCPAAGSSGAPRGRCAGDPGATHQRSGKRGRSLFPRVGRGSRPGPCPQSSA